MSIKEATCVDERGPDERCWMQIHRIRKSLSPTVSGHKEKHALRDDDFD